jgi:hypothetical protein
MKNFLIATGAIIMLFIAFVTGMKFGQNQLRKEYRALVGNQSEVYHSLNQEAKSLKRHMEILQDSISKISKDRKAYQKQKGQELTKLRKKKPVNVPVTNIQWAECDSAKAVGSYYKAESEKRSAQIDSCREAVAVQDSALENMEAELIGADMRHEEDKKTLKEAEENLQNQKKWTKVWRLVAITTTAVSTLVVVALLR